MFVLAEGVEVRRNVTCNHRCLMASQLRGDENKSDVCEQSFNARQRSRACRKEREKSRLNALDTHRRALEWRVSPGNSSMLVTRSRSYFALSPEVLVIEVSMRGKPSSTFPYTQHSMKVDCLTRSEFDIDKQIISR